MSGFTLIPVSLADAKVLRDQKSSKTSAHAAWFAKATAWIVANVKPGEAFPLDMLTMTTDAGEPLCKSSAAHQTYVKLVKRWNEESHEGYTLSIERKRAFGPFTADDDGKCLALIVNPAALDAPPAVPAVPASK